MFYLKWWMCEAGQTVGNVAGHSVHFEMVVKKMVVRNLFLNRFMVKDLGQSKAFKRRRS